MPSAARACGASSATGYALARGATRSEVFEQALQRWLRDRRRRSLEEDTERYYSSLSAVERAEDSNWAGIAPRVLGETWA